MEVAPELLGAVLTVDRAVAVRLTEVEAYEGRDDPASHAFRGPTPRTEVMFGPPGHVYVYFTYGMHWCMNLVCRTTGSAGAVLLRAGAVICGETLARSRRTTSKVGADLARGPARLTTALGITGADGGADLLDPAGRLTLALSTVDTPIATGPRVGVSAGTEQPWRFWLIGDPTVSPYRPRRSTGAADSRG